MTSLHTYKLLIIYVLAALWPVIRLFISAGQISGKNCIKIKCGNFRASSAGGTILHICSDNSFHGCWCAQSEVLICQRSEGLKDLYPSITNIPGRKMFVSCLNNGNGSVSTNESCFNFYYDICTWAVHLEAAGAVKQTFVCFPFVSHRWVIFNAQVKVCTSETYDSSTAGWMGWYLSLNPLITNHRSVQRAGSVCFLGLAE